ncbi:MAG: 5'-methylthioadenosine/adenosylhomocysteine nucleosidase [Muribaculaceae bacterium]|nr:5'-methylthioadenosine/adenosylhomocysteine nucleosidase [Muribaculaceae bacterium]
MKTGIIVAMDKELALLLPLIKDCSEITVNDITFRQGHIDGRAVVVAKSGIGKVNAAMTTLTMIENFHVALIINTGVAGGTGLGANILDVVIADRVAYHDVWCGPDTIPGQASGCPLFFVNPLLRNILEKIPGVKVGLIATGDTFISTPDEIERIRGLYPDVMAVDMESAAIAQVCHIKNVPFMSIRVVSDTPGQDDNIAQYENFWSDAPKSSFATLLNILALL